MFRTCKVKTVDLVVYHRFGISLNRDHGKVESKDKVTRCRIPESPRIHRRLRVLGHGLDRSRRGVRVLVLMRGKEGGLVLIKTNRDED